MELERKYQLFLNYLFHLCTDEQHSELLMKSIP